MSRRFIQESVETSDSIFKHVAKTSLRKHDIEDFLNKLFRVNIKWSKLTRDELVELYNVLTREECRRELIKRLGGYVEDDLAYVCRDIMLRYMYEKARTLDGPVIRLLKNLLGEGADVLFSKE